MERKHDMPSTAYGHAFQPWTPEEEDRLVNESASQTLSLAQIAARHARSIKAITMRLHQLIQRYHQQHPAVTMNELSVRFGQPLSVIESCLQQPPPSPPSHDKTALPSRRDVLGVIESRLDRIDHHLDRLLSPPSHDNTTPSSRRDVFGVIESRLDRIDHHLDRLLRRLEKLQKTIVLPPSSTQ